ncbi:hypothetical protein HJG60_010626 [Phyllostomus discolor]|uniref:Uncharacterized protein n=1 Tax=Phyllostomus discolor TaxID=89673 RepID=A0A834AP53_9CHIR|nr:hypothetical protein HJG60_010626 [Phyllostomus discolor]
MWMKAKKLYDSFVESMDINDSDEDEDEDDNAEAGLPGACHTRPSPFSISKDWSDKFQRQFGLKSISLYGETASADKKQLQQLPRTMFNAQMKRSVIPTPLVEIEVTAQGEDTAPSDEVVPSEEL